MKFLSSVAAAAATSGAVLGATIGLAGPAWADLPSGAYTATVIDGGGFLKNGVTKNWTFAPCGPDCLHFDNGTVSTDLHQQGVTWDGTTGDGITVSIDPDASLATVVFSAGSRTVWQLTKNG